MSAKVPGSGTPVAENVAEWSTLSGLVISKVPPMVLYKSVPTEEVPPETGPIDVSKAYVAKALLAISNMSLLVLASTNPARVEPWLSPTKIVSVNVSVPTPETETVAGP